VHTWLTGLSKLMMPQKALREPTMGMLHATLILREGNASHLTCHVGSVDEHVCIVLWLIWAHACCPVLEVGVVCIDIAQHSVVPLQVKII
jgi:hypothetical protein